jgi:hypothetical protein
LVLGATALEHVSVGAAHSIQQAERVIFPQNISSPRGPVSDCDGEPPVRAPPSLLTKTLIAARFVSRNGRLREELLALAYSHGGFSRFVALVQLDNRTSSGHPRWAATFSPKRELRVKRLDVWRVWCRCRTLVAAEFDRSLVASSPMK